MGIQIPFDNSYGRLPPRFFTKMPPEPVKSPGLVKVNHTLARKLGLDPADLEIPAGVAILAGNAVPDGAEPLAQVYAGHQFGGWSPQLGDGRAILLGEVVDEDGNRRDIQLKGSGRTPYSRMGDGRAWLGPVLREYVVSEAMHAFGIPTTRALAAVTTGEDVLREAAFPGAVLTRVAASHIRVGTFQFFASRQDIEALEALARHAIARHYPEAETALDLLNGVIERQARLVAAWMGVGFIHGVMNTDNTTISGETIDYGPCAFMDGYVPGKVYSSIDQFGRYAFDRQPDILVWNLAQLATSVLPLIDDDLDTAVETATAAVHRFPDLFNAAWIETFSRKLGLETSVYGDEGLISAVLDQFAELETDFTNGFRDLSGTLTGDLKDRWIARLGQEGATPETAKARLDSANPAFIPRNHRIEEAIQSAVYGDYRPFERLVAVLSRPFADQPDAEDLRQPPTPEEEVRQTFCGT